VSIFIILAIFTIFT